MVLRPYLYGRLRRRFGEVKVSNAGQEIRWGLREVNGRTCRQIDKAKGHHPGEFYRVCCPYCHDRRFRLYINHMWGHKDELTGALNLWLAHCMNEHCLDRYEQQKALYDLVFDDFMSGVACDVVIAGKEPDLRTGEVDWPGLIWPMDRVVPDHPARLYLESRRFSSEWLAKFFNVGVLVETKQKYHYLDDRIVIPVYQEGKAVGWQARYVGTPPGKETPKYVTMPGMPRSQVLYNLDNAKNYPHVVVVEGPTDVWRFGPEAVAVLGKPASYQIGMIQRSWRRVVILLDPDAKRESREVLDILGKTNEVVEVSLPDGQDPGDFPDTRSLRGYVHAEATRQGFVL